MEANRRPNWGGGWQRRLYYTLGIVFSGMFLAVALAPGAPLSIRALYFALAVGMGAICWFLGRVEVRMRSDALGIQNAFRRYVIAWGDIDVVLPPAQLTRPVWTSLIFSYGFLMRWGLSPRIRLNDGREIPAIAIRCGIPETGRPEDDPSLVALNEAISTHRA